MKIYFNKPYKQLQKQKEVFRPKDSTWAQTALPLGNGSLGLSALGGIKKEQITVNCKTFWTGGPSEKRPDYCGGNLTGADENGKTRLDYFHEARDAFLNGKDDEGSRICEKLVGGKDGYGAYQCMGEIRIAFDRPTLKTGAYSRALDLDTAVCTTEIERKKGNTAITETRRYFVSYPDKVSVLRLERTGAPLCCTLAYPAHHGAEITVNESGICHRGALKDNGLLFAASLAVETDGRISVFGKALKIRNATYVNAYLAADTDYCDNYPVYRTGESADALVKRVDQTVKSAQKKGFDALLAAHLEDYQALFARTALTLGGGKELPADELLFAYSKKDCPPAVRRSLEELLYQYGRYLTIAASRDADMLPSNLQGIWNHTNHPMWSCDFHLNINLQMNYWPTFTGNLAECAAPLLRYVKALCAPGRVTAAIYTGRESTETEHNGFLYHTQNTPFGWTCPGWDFSWGWSPVAVAWILHNLYEMYEYTCDKALLETEIYPMLTEAADYFESLLVEKDGRLVTVPCFSPEHGPRTAGNTYEQSMLWQLLYDVTESAKVLGLDKEKTAHRLEIMEKLRPIEIGESGQIKEWYHEKALGAIGERQHRHLSHLLGLYPGNLINRHTNPEYIAAAKVSLDDRGDRSTGWAMAQRICARARTGDGDRALKLVGMLIENGLYVNLWDVCPPFQIDGNYGFTAAVTEMLMQSHLGQIDLLPALPAAWQNGEIRGLVARGNFELSFSWKDGKLQDAEVLSRAGGICKIALENGKLAFRDSRACTYDENGCLVFDTVKGETYQLTAV
ncbi:MAG: glycosyl hydrolase family 95 catalytic domain-containing protein [Candidatus Fimenecus sp.]